MKTEDDATSEWHAGPTDGRYQFFGQLARDRQRPELPKDDGGFFTTSEATTWLVQNPDGIDMDEAQSDANPATNQQFMPFADVGLHPNVASILEDMIVQGMMDPITAPTHPNVLTEKDANLKEGFQATVSQWMGNNVHHRLGYDSPIWPWQRYCTNDLHLQVNTAYYNLLVAFTGLHHVHWRDILAAYLRAQRRVQLAKRKKRATATPYRWRQDGPRRDDDDPPSGGQGGRKGGGKGPSAGGGKGGQKGYQGGKGGHHQHKHGGGKGKGQYGSYYTRGGSYERVDESTASPTPTNHPMKMFTGAAFNIEANCTAITMAQAHATPQHRLTEGSNAPPDRMTSAPTDHHNSEASTAANQARTTGHRHRRDQRPLPQHGVVNTLIHLTYGMLPGQGPRDQTRQPHQSDYGRGYDSHHESHGGHSSGDDRERHDRDRTHGSHRYSHAVSTLPLIDEDEERKKKRIKQEWQPWTASQNAQGRTPESGRTDGPHESRPESRKEHHQIYQRYAFLPPTRPSGPPPLGSSHVLDHMVGPKPGHHVRILEGHQNGRDGIVYAKEGRDLVVGFIGPDGPFTENMADDSCCVYPNKAIATKDAWGTPLLQWAHPRTPPGPLPAFVSREWIAPIAAHDAQPPPKMEDRHDAVGDAIYITDGPQRGRYGRITAIRDTETYVDVMDPEHGTITTAMPKAWYTVYEEDPSYSPLPTPPGDEESHDDKPTRGTTHDTPDWTIDGGGGGTDTFTAAPGDTLRVYVRIPDPDTPAGSYELSTYARFVGGHSTNRSIVNVQVRGTGTITGTLPHASMYRCHTPIPRDPPYSCIMSVTDDGPDIWDTKPLAGPPNPGDEVRVFIILPSPYPGNGIMRLNTTAKVVDYWSDDELYVLKVKLPNDTTTTGTLPLAALHQTDSPEPDDRSFTPLTNATAPVWDTPLDLERSPFARRKKTKVLAKSSPRREASAEGGTVHQPLRPAKPIRRAATATH